MQPDAYPHINTHTQKHIWTLSGVVPAYKYSHTELHPAYRTKSFIHTHLPVFPLSLNSFGMLNDWGSLEDTATDVSGIHLSVKPECVCCGCLCFCKCQNKETVQWIFHSSTLPLPCAASQCWPLKHAGVHSNKLKQKHTHTHLFSQQTQLSTPRVSFAEVSCRSNHRANTPAVGIWSCAIHLPALLWARVQPLHTNRLCVNQVTAGIPGQLCGQKASVKSSYMYIQDIKAASFEYEKNTC